MLKFPFDTQKCSLDFGNVLEPAEVVNITTDMKAVDLQFFYPSNEFEVSSDEVGRVVYTVGLQYIYRYVRYVFICRSLVLVRCDQPSFFLYNSFENQIVMFTVRHFY